MEGISDTRGSTLIRSLVFGFRIARSADQLISSLVFEFRIARAADHENLVRLFKIHRLVNSKVEA
jgi:hypothetical protein